MTQTLMQSEFKETDKFKGMKGADSAGIGSSPSRYPNRAVSWCQAESVVFSAQDVGPMNLCLTLRRLNDLADGSDACADLVPAVFAEGDHAVLDCEVSDLAG